ncbi:MAG: hypothetical protein M3O66_06390 [Verrucomicrobiota bacterium]|nr:hypothetical protein [Verrucomicrobiota bacterium]
MKRAKQKRSRKRGDGYPVPRVYHRKARGKQSARLLIKCGDCASKVEIYYGPDGEDLEIAGVLASVENWREILLPLLKDPPRRKLQYRPLEEYLAERAKRAK